jgi:hypothetical protein
VYQNGDVYDG